MSNVYRTASAPNSDTVVSAGLLGGIDQRLGRQHLKLDGSLQNNRYSTNSDLNYRSHSVRAALDWETVGDLSGLLSAKSDRSMADFNIGGGTAQIFRKNIETNEQYQAIARLGVGTRYTLEGGWTQRKRDFSVEEYDRYVYDQNTGSVAIYATPGGNVRLGISGRRTKGQNPRYPVGTGTQVNDYTRSDIDFTTRWNVGGHSTLNTRISRSRSNNSIDQLRDFSGTTGAIGWTWRPTAKLQFETQYARDSGQESVVRATELNRVYNSWQLSGGYQLTGKLSLNAQATRNRLTRDRDSGDPVIDALDDTKTHRLGIQWAFSRVLSLTCQYDHISREHSVSNYAYSASSYGCTGQAVFF